MNNYNSPENPEFLNNYLVHMKIVKLLAQRTIEEYYTDIRLFLRYIYENQYNTGKNLEDIDIRDMTVSDIRKISITDIYNFIFYTSDERGNKDRARYRKISSLRSFFKYLEKVAHIIESDPTKDLDVPVPKTGLPKFLSLKESLKLLETADNADSKRDYCIITLFLNCGMRLSELVGINIRDIDFTENRLKVLGKRSKERMVYLNPACIDALQKYLVIRNNNPKAASEPALFISNQNRRISKRRVQQIVEDTLQKAELDGKGITTHKLRHTAATLMYQYGDADVLTLKELLGHSSISTTEIYTHLNDENVRNAVESNPLARIKSDNSDDNKD
ncbi:tyrosine-type recombinase/integrase [Ruminococcus flavefaciens]|uniref:Site-specific recombinase XerD n=1 Tax=Ruminococcus flavefaciens TaxID=1265 RepID=A0A1M7HA84_RUMFL|nr:tyrosine-type recombinase/integrase [Ruminococcus flavefaciens]SHM25338.1 Site-specific recombinase XerD [Ruminococcus flavefaciens]